MNDTAKQAKKKMTGTRPKQKRMGSIAILSALLGLMGGYATQNSGGGRRLALVGRERRDQYRKDHPDTVEAIINLAAAKRERKQVIHRRNALLQSVTYYRGEWQPKPHSSKPEPQERGRPVPTHRTGGARYTVNGVNHG